MSVPALQVEWVPLDRLHLNPSNPRLNDDAVEHVVASLKRFGWQQPIVAKPNGEVIAGNTRIKAAKSLRMEQVPVVWFDGTDLDAVAYGIADNRTAEYAEWEQDSLARLLEKLRDEDALDGVGFSLTKSTRSSNRTGRRVPSARALPAIFLARLQVISFNVSRWRKARATSELLRPVFVITRTPDTPGNS